MRWILLGLGVIGLAACTTQTVIRVDFTKSAGAYVVGYTADPVIRIRFEEQLVADLRARELIAYPSHVDIPDITASNRGELIASANAREVIGIVVINQVAADASDSIVQDPKRVSPTHPDLQPILVPRGRHERAKLREKALRNLDAVKELFLPHSSFVLSLPEWLM